MAGTSQAAKAVSARAQATATYVVGSVEVTPNNIPVNARLTAKAPPTPSNNPTPTKRAASVSTNLKFPPSAGKISL